jgi:hypothetical protein
MREGKERGRGREGKGRGGREGRGAKERGGDRLMDWTPPSLERN